MEANLRANALFPLASVAKRGVFSCFVVFAARSEALWEYSDVMFGF